MSRLSEMMKLYCRMNAVSSRQIAAATGMAHTTVTRFMSGKRVDSEHFLSILNWLMEPAQSQEGK